MFGVLSREDGNGFFPIDKPGEGKPDGKPGEDWETLL